MNRPQKKRQARRGGRITTGRVGRSTAMVRTVPVKKAMYSGHYFSRYVNLAGVWTAQGSANQADHLSLAATAGATFAPGAGGGTDWFVLTMPANTVNYAQIAYALHYADIAGSAELGQVFDQYKIKGFAIKIAPSYNTYIAGANAGGTGGAPAGYSIPLIHSAPDYDDVILYANSTEAGVDLMKERWGYKTSRLDGHNRIFSRYIPSAVKVGVSGPAGSALLSLGRKSKTVWIDAQSTGVANYGIKIFIECANTAAVANTMQFKIECKVYFQMRGSH